LSQFWPLLKWTSFFEVSESILKIGTSLKPNHHNEVQLVQIYETLCTRKQLVNVDEIAIFSSSIYQMFIYQTSSTKVGLNKEINPFKFEVEKKEPSFPYNKTPSRYKHTILHTLTLSTSLSLSLSLSHTHTHTHINSFKWISAKNLQSSSRLRDEG